MRDLITLFKALSDGTRIRIIKLLEGGELCVCHLMEVLQMNQSRISRHMGILKSAGLVNDRREGRWVYYSLSEEALNPYGPEMIRCLRGWLNEEVPVASDRRRLSKQLEKINGNRPAPLELAAPEDENGSRRT
ncbi:MAG: metalloregulator ArsR/SmtB family transcription factor [Candidatus Tectomicrobia bacterium]|uniref:Metalloregulator ArsR/SmtB family transcription factor n=1 Tax=Tectimicrobiota bacterium TaxID=2528274 RepID=A0A932FXC4_UNCTE|nr:metalloregulator ArsR/SmtB family transcription factor [Candidatus Tectomicrobia bacterium]